MAMWAAQQSFNDQVDRRIERARAEGGDDAANAEDRQITREVLASNGGAVAGAAAGALIGSVIPGFGTIAGAMVGSLLGGFGGLKAVSKD